MRSERAGMVYTKAHAVLPFPVVIRMTAGVLLQLWMVGLVLMQVLLLVIGGYTNG